MCWGESWVRGGVLGWGSSFGVLSCRGPCRERREAGIRWHHGGKRSFGGNIFGSLRSQQDGGGHGGQAQGEKQENPSDGQVLAGETGESCPKPQTRKGVEGKNEIIHVPCPSPHIQSSIWPLTMSNKCSCYHSSSQVFIKRTIL